MKGGRIIPFRVAGIRNLLRTGRRLGVADLAERFEVSESTIKRDINLLRDYGCNITFDRFKKSFCLVKDAEVFPECDFSEGEIVSLYLIDKLIHQLSGTPYAESLASAGAKLRCLLTDRLEFPLEREVDFISITYDPLRGDEVRLGLNFATLREAWRTRRSVMIEHFSVQRGEATRRRLNPFHLLFRHGIWYVIGFCHLRREVRMFALDRIQEIVQTDETFEIPSDFELNMYLGSCWGIERGDLVTVRVKFDAYQAKWIRERQWHTTQEIEERADGGLIFTAQASGLREIKEWVLSFGEHAEVLEPEELRWEVRETVKAMGRFYCD